MLFRSRVAACALIALAIRGFAAEGRGDGGPEAGAVADTLPAKVTSNADAAVDRALGVIDLVVEHHFQPPTRQEMVLQGAYALYEAARPGPPADLARRASSLAGRDDDRRFLSEAFSRAVARGGDLASLETKLLEGVLRPVGGNASLVPTKELRVQEQLQANRYVGIGITLGIDADQKQPQMHPFPDGPGAKAGVNDGDLIESVDGKPVKGKRLDEVVDLLRGPEGSAVTLVLRRPGDSETRTLTITRGVVPRQTVHGWGRDQAEPFRMQPSLPIAYVRLEEIGGSSAHELRQLEQRFETGGEFRALVIDLRHVSRGSHHDAALLADALLDDGPIGQLRTRDRVQEFRSDGEVLFRGWPLAVIVSEDTAGCAEWVAAALQDRRRAVIVGRPTAGKAAARSGFEVSGSELSLVLPTGILERPSGKSMLRGRPESNVDGLELLTARHDEWGVQPDYRVDAAAMRPVAIEPQRQIARLQAVLGAGGDRLAEAEVIKACEVLTSWLEKNLDQAPTERGTRIRRGADDE